MRFIVMHKVDSNMEAGVPPSPDIIKNMGGLVQGSLKTGVFENGAGLHRSAVRVRLRYSNGKRTVTKGPLTGDQELVGRFAMIRVPDIDQAIEQAGRFAKVLGDTEIEVGPVVEPWDIGVMPKPEGNLPGRYLLLFKNEAGAENVALPATTLDALESLTNELKSQGVLLMADSILPSARGARLKSGARGQRKWTDGPFTESKELIAGFSILNLPTREAAIAWADRYAEILDGNEVDVRELV